MNERDGQTLKDLWSHHWNRRPLLRSKVLDVIGMVSFPAAFVFILATNCLIVIPQIHSTNAVGVFYALVAIAIVTIEIALNWLACWFLGKSDIVERELAKKTGNIQGWMHCAICQLNSPQRSHHCQYCEACVLKRDVHCFAIGRCIGFHNQRHFIVFLFYCTCASLVSGYLLILYLFDMDISIWQCVLPITVWEWLVEENIGLAQVFVLLILYTSIIGGVVAAWFFLWEVSTVINGQTTFEAAHNIGRYQGDSLMQRINSVFGPFSGMQFILPCPFIPQLGDGINWTSSKQNKGH